MKETNYIITESAKERFRKYLFDERISCAEFARRTGVSRQYIQAVLHGKKPVTPKVREIFKKGGYEFL